MCYPFELKIKHFCLILSVIFALAPQLVSADATIVKYYVADAAPGSTYETGPIHIVYSDGKEVVEKLPPQEKSTEDMTVLNPEGISDPQLAEDQQTMGWSESYETPGANYSTPQVLVLYRSGKIIQRLQDGQMLWGWTFLKGGNKVAAQWGPLHGSMGIAIRLYQVETGKILSEFTGNESDMPHAPAWAKEAQAQIDSSNR